MKTTFYTFIILFFSGLSYSQDADCPCPKFPKWQRLMDKGKYDKAYELAEEILTFKNDGPIGENIDHDKFERKYGKTNCYRWYLAEAAYKKGEVHIIRHSYAYGNQNIPQASYRFRFYFIEDGKQLFAKNDIEGALSELEFAWQMSTELDMEKCSEKDIENNQVMFQLAELLGDVYTANKDYKNALKYYKFYDNNKYSSEINNKIAFAKQNLVNKQ